MAKRISVTTKATKKKAAMSRQEPLLHTLFEDERPPLPGFRLSKLELMNWGTFDQAVYSMHAKGQTTLLVGENGSGKSTVVDALLTLLVRPQSRNYNVAAGATKNERDERTYIKGAHDRTIGSDDRPQVQFLRSGHGHYTVLLACFQNETLGKWITLCQVLYLNADQSVERIYAYCEKERGIVQDLGGLSSAASLAKQLRERGFETTSSYSQYFQWLQKQTGLRTKAMDVFNQTVAVKDVQRLDVFVRQHMLERQPWNERVSKLLLHFSELSEAHGMLVKVRMQNELLKPIVEAGKVYRKRLDEHAHAKRRLDATPLYFANERARLLEPLCAQWGQQIRYYQDQIKDRDGLLERLRTTIARLDFEIENAGGDRLRQLPRLIEQAQQMAKVKSSERTRYEGALRASGISIQVTSPEQFHKVRLQIEERRKSLMAQRDQLRKSEGDLQYEIGRLKRLLDEDKAELISLERRKGNLPESLIAMRDALCRNLKISPTDLPFVAELLEVKQEDREWEASIEQALHGFARSLLVSNDFYQRVAGYVDATRLEDGRGQGQRLVYLRVSLRNKEHRESADNRGLPSKLNYRSHSLTPWVKGELVQRFDYLACDSIEEFKESSGPAMTRNRHFKSGETRHEKDDRWRANERRHFVLGWDNREKQSELKGSILATESDLIGLRLRVTKLAESIDRDTAALESLDQVSQVQDFDKIDYEKHEFEASQLRIEKEKLEESNDVIRDLRAQATAARAEAAGHQLDRDQFIAKRTTLESELKNGSNFLENAKRMLQKATESGELEHCQPLFDPLSLEVGEPLSMENLGTLPDTFERQLRAKVDGLFTKLTPVARDLTSAMTKFLRHFPEKTDLDSDVAALESFEALYERISLDDLPRHEERFKNRLNEKVLHEVGLLNGSLENDRQEIRDKIELLNGALRQLEWKTGTYMRLEATDVSDREIQDFRRDLANCLSGTLDGTAEANEATFQRIDKLVGRLRDEANTRWREKVVDVRNWFNFAARELVLETGESRSYYDGGTGQSGGEKGKLAFLVLVAAIAYQYDLSAKSDNSHRFQFVMVDEMFSRSDDQHAEYALELFQKFGLQLLIVAPLDSKVRVTEPYVGTYVHVVKDKDTHRSELISITAEQVRDSTEDDHS